MVMFFHRFCFSSCLAPGPCPAWVPVLASINALWPRIYKPNKLISPRLLLVMVLSQQQRADRATVSVYVALKIKQGFMSTRWVFYQQTSLLPSLSGVFREISVVNKQHQRRQKSGLIKWLSRETCLSTKAESYTEIPHGERAPKTPTNCSPTQILPQAPPKHTVSVILKTENHQ